MIELKKVTQYVSDKIESFALVVKDYVTTDNMLPDRGGVVWGEWLPQNTRVTKYISGDVLVSNIRPYFKKIWFADRIGGCSNDVIVFRADTEQIDAKFLYYVLSQESFFDFMMAGANGTKMPRGNKKLILDFKIPNYDIKKQKCIASALSAYDDIIGNNKKQIKLLEEAAQRLYKEWFVDLRFPGYEDVEIVDGVPVGWKRTVIGKYVSVRSGYAFKSDWWKNNGYPVVKIKDIMDNTIDLSEVDYVEPDKTTRIPEFKLNKHDIVVAMTGATIGKIGLVPEVDNLYTNQRVGKFFPKECIAKKTGFFFCYYTQSKVLEEILAISSSSSAQPNISGKQLESFEVVVNEEFIDKFNDLVEPYLDKISDLRKQILILKEARDHLLPKLMSGEVEV